VKSLVSEVEVLANDLLADDIAGSLVAESLVRAADVSLELLGVVVVVRWSVEAQLWEAGAELPLGVDQALSPAESTSVEVLIAELA
jgi:hypothetical protein